MNTPEEITVLIGKFLAGEAGPEEAIRLEDWKAENPENLAYYQSCEQIFGRTGKAIDPGKAWKQVRERIQPEAEVRKVRFSFAQIAAIFLVVLGVGGMTAYFVSYATGRKQTFTAGNTQKNLQLGDGTQIQLAANSELELDADYNGTNRKVKLKGSAYFTVEHDEQKEFVIDAGPIFIKDLGTKFDVKTGTDTIFIKVDEGSVMIYNEKGLKIKLEAHEPAYYVISNGSLKITVENDSYVKRAPIKLIFENQTLKTIVAGLNQMYTADIRIAGPALENCRLTTSFNDEKLETVLEVIAETLGITVEEKDGYYLLSGKGC
ncbi:MAG: FecR family protein [Bacteroidota bacterium]